MISQNMPTMIIAIAVLVFLGLFLIIRFRNKKYKPNYRFFFIIGLTWIPLGIATENNVFTIVGAVFTIVGFINRSKWKDERKLGDLPPTERRLKLMVIIGLSILIAVGIILALTKS